MHIAILIGLLLGYLLAYIEHFQSPVGLGDLDPEGVLRFRRNHQGFTRAYPVLKLWQLDPGRLHLLGHICILSEEGAKYSFRLTFTWRDSVSIVLRLGTWTSLTLRFWPEPDVILEKA